MNTVTRSWMSCCAALACGVCVPVCLAQPGVVAPGAPIKPGAVPLPAAPQQQFQPAPTPKYESLVTRDGAGKIVRLTGVIDALALQHNPTVDDAARAAMAPVIAEWTAEVNGIAIDNLDFVEQIEGGLLETYDVNDAARTRLIQQMNVQLSAAGPLSARLTQKNAFTGQGAGLNMQISNEYIQGVFNEINSAPPVPGTDPKTMPYANAAAVNRFFTSLSSRDACAQYRRMLLDSAGMLDKILPELPAPVRERAAARVPAVKGASDDVGKMVAVQTLLKGLTFDERRAFLTKAVELGAAADPFHPAPELPMAAAAPVAIPAAKPN